MKRDVSQYMPYRLPGSQVAEMVGLHGDWCSEARGFSTLLSFITGPWFLARRKTRGGSKLWASWISGVFAVRGCAARTHARPPV